MLGVRLGYSLSLFRTSEYSWHNAQGAQKQCIRQSSQKLPSIKYLFLILPLFIAAPIQQHNKGHKHALKND